MITARLKTIADMIHESVITADIGTDHALLPVYLIENQIAEKAYACDVREGPLKMAQKNIADYGLEDRVIPILSDGFDRVPADTDTAVIAGMGFYTAGDILERALDRLPLLKRIIVEVNHDEDKMRRWISDHHYTIEEEAVVSDRGFCYTVTAFSAKPHAPYSEEEILCGVSAEMKKSPAYREYAGRQIRKYEQIVQRAKEPSVIENARYLKTIWEKQLENAE